MKEVNIIKHEWRKKEKELYLPIKQPIFLNIKKMKFITIDGQGNPNRIDFQKKTEALYSFSYAVKMACKKGISFKNYYDYTVYPLEGVWDISEDAKKRGDFTKDDFVYKIMIRQPEFFDNKVFEYGKEAVKNKGMKLFDELRFEEIEEGLCVQMMHIGSYDAEDVSFKMMEGFCGENGYKRVSKVHREIYLSDPRKVMGEKLKTVLRFKILDL